MYDMYQGPDATELFGLASGQAGYFTAAQARTCGYDWPLLSYHTGTGRFIRLRRGLYRLRDYPSSRHEEVMAAWLAVGRESAAVSHESALDLLDLSDVVPNAVHLLVPRARRGLPPHPGVELHTSTRPLAPHDVVIREGMRVTAPARTLLDVAALGTAPEQVIFAVVQARERGWLTADDLLTALHGRGTRVESLIQQGLRGA